MLLTLVLVVHFYASLDYESMIWSIDSNVEQMDRACMLNDMGLKPISSLPRVLANTHDHGNNNISLSPF